jgi:hypothetical protein
MRTMKSGQAMPTVKTIGLLSITFFAATAIAAGLESEAELRAIEKAHSAVTEIKADFRRSITEATKKDLKKSLPGCRIKNLRFDEMKVGRTSHRLRNQENAPPEWTKPYLEKFSKAKPSEIPKHVLTKIGPHRYGYIEPVFVEPICLNCHGRGVEKDVQDAIRETYPKDQALNFDVGDFRGLVWLEIKDQ